ncbi:MAG: FecR domain-containing protein [Bacteroidota bacterium]
MSGKEIDTYYSDLISKYLSKNASSAEVEELETWVLAAPENKELFMASKKAWILSGMKEEAQSVDVEKAFTQLSAMLQAETKVIDLRPANARRRWFGIAAAIALLVVGIMWLVPRTSSSDPLIVQASDDIQAVALADGSQVILNQTSSLVFTPSGESSARMVQLEGDAFFEVARDEAHPFVIETKGLEIEVLGTSFYVDARPSQSEIQVIVESGRVAVRAGGEETILTAKEKAVFSKDSQQLVKQSHADPNHLALKTNKLVFEDARLEEVIFVLNRQYRVQISIEQEPLKDCLLTATFDDKPLSTILKSLESAFDIEVERIDDQIILRGEGSCDS